MNESKKYFSHKLIFGEIQTNINKINQQLQQVLSHHNCELISKIVGQTLTDPGW